MGTTYNEVKLMLERIKLLDELLNTKLTKEQLDIVDNWCKTDGFRMEN